MGRHIHGSPRHVMSQVEKTVGAQRHACMARSPKERHHAALSDVMDSLKATSRRVVSHGGRRGSKASDAAVLAGDDRWSAWRGTEADSDEDSSKTRRDILNIYIYSYMVK